MEIKFVEVENFRRLKSSRIHFGRDNTIFTGPNNSGKTTAMKALIKFLKKDDKLLMNDFTLSVHKEINKIGKEWEEKHLRYEDTEISEDEIETTIKRIDKIVPKLDIWLEVGDGEEMYVEELLPTLNWTNEDNLGIRITLDIGNNLTSLYRDYINGRIDCNKAKVIEPNVKLWPLNLVDFLSGNKESILGKYFSKKVYILDLAKIKDDGFIFKNNNLTELQSTSRSVTPLPLEILDKLFKVNIIDAQRGFRDDEGDPLSKQLHSYYTKHLDMEIKPSEEDIKIRRIQQDTDDMINDGLDTSFKSAIDELNNLGYPGFSDPQLRITTATDMSEQIVRSTRLTNKINEDYDIPESYNGLGYQNLISMTFHMIEYRDGWMRKGKKYESETIYNIPKLHLVLIEEPEAYLHVQVQEVFIKNAYKTLTKDVSDKYNTQLVISTHSSSIVNGAEFENIRFFKKQKVDDEVCPVSSVIDMHDVFNGKDPDNTKRFVKRYIKSSHCDLFFADGIILVEGKAESILLPHFIANQFEELNNTYISILEVGGRHMYTLRPLIERLGVPCLVITDLDAGEIDGQHSKMQPSRGSNCTTTNTTIRFWLRNLEGKKNGEGKVMFETLNDILDIKDEDKHPTHSITSDICRDIRFTYQNEIEIRVNNKCTSYIPSTFEDALIAKNLDIFIESMKGDDGNKLSKGSIEKINDILKDIKDKEKFKNELHDLPKVLEKAEFALDLFYLEDLKGVKPPDYISEGLDWLIKRLKEREQELVFCGEVESCD